MSHSFHDKLSALVPAARLHALADPASLIWLPAAGASPYLARRGITPAPDDGIIRAQLRIGGKQILAAAQDARFLSGSVGANHGAALRDLFERALAERPAAVVLLLDSGGVRLHEANAAELVLAHALRALFDVRCVGIATVAFVIGHAFGGASVLAAACANLHFFAQAQFGLSGPGVIETAHGKAELDADADDEVAMLYGAQARVSAGMGALIADDAAAIRCTVEDAIATAAVFDADALERWDRALAARLARAGLAPASAPETPPAWPCFDDADPVDPARWLWRMRGVERVGRQNVGKWSLSNALAQEDGHDLYLLRPLAPHHFAPAAAVAIANALRSSLPRAASLVIVEDSPGHATRRAAEAIGVSEYLAAHAGRLNLLRQEGHALLGLLVGVGHSAAFFVNALQAPVLDAVRDARVEAMSADAIARVLHIPATELATLIEDDPMLGQPVRHLQALGGVAHVHDTLTAQSLLERWG